MNSSMELRKTSSKKEVNTSKTIDFTKSSLINGETKNRRLSSVSQADLRKSFDERRESNTDKTKIVLEEPKNTIIPSLRELSENENVPQYMDTFKSSLDDSIVSGKTHEELQEISKRAVRYAIGVGKTTYEIELAYKKAAFYKKSSQIIPIKEQINRLQGETVEKCEAREHLEKKLKVAELEEQNLLKEIENFIQPETKEKKIEYYTERFLNKMMHLDMFRNAERLSDKQFWQQAFFALTIWGKQVIGETLKQAQQAMYKLVFEQKYKI